MVTRRPGISLGILTADCVPVLFADPRAGMIGAAHAGWRGALKGVLENTIGVMVELGAKPEDIVAGIGPAIQQTSYEVGPEFPAPFLEDDPSNRHWFRPGRTAGRWQFDLVGYVMDSLARAGVGHIENAGLDTCSDDARFFSHRRMVHRGEADYGRQLSVIGLV
jgi:YfiH family protein